MQVKTYILLYCTNGLARGFILVTQVDPVLLSFCLVLPSSLGHRCVLPCSLWPPFWGLLPLILSHPWSTLSGLPGMHMEARGQPWVTFLRSCSPCVLIQNVPLAWSSGRRMASLASKSQAPSIQCQDKHAPCAQLCYVGSDLHDHVAAFYQLSCLCGSSSTF